MKKLVIVASALALAPMFAHAQAGADAELSANAANAAVQQQLSEPDGVAITIKSDGSFQIFSRGSGEYQFNNPKAKRVALQTATQRAKANLAKFLAEKLASKEGIDSITKNSLAMTGDGKVQEQKASMESVETATESIRNEAEAILTGVITLKDQTIPSGMGGSVQVTVGISTKTLLAAKRLGQGINESLSGRDDPSGSAPQNAVKPVADAPSTRVSNTDF